MRAAIIAHCPPTPPWSGERRKAAAWHQYLSEHYDCDVLVPRLAGGGMGRVVRMARHPFAPPFAAHYAWDPGLLRPSKLEKYDIIVVYELWALAAVPRSVWPRVIWDKDQLVGAQYATSDLRRVRLMSHWISRFERSAMGRVRHSFLSTREDVLALGLPRVTFLPHGFEPAPASPRWNPPLDRPIRLGFVGVLGYGANREGLRWFIDDVLPGLRDSDELGSVELWIAGGELSDEDRALFERSAGVQLLGYVPDLNQLYQDVDVVIAPFLRGKGAPTKVIEALGHGVPVVGPPTALRGLAPELRRVCFETNGADWSDQIQAALAVRPDFSEARWKDEYTWHAVIDRHLKSVLQVQS